MARPRAFDADVALGDMMQSFWANGYEATSIDDLCEASGLSRSSLYSAFGDKRELLLRSLARYMESRTGHIRDVLLVRRPIRDGFAALAAEIIDDVIAGPGRRGCFLGNCAAEIPSDDHQAIALIREGMANIENIFHDALIRARAHGELPPEADIEAMPRFLAAAFQGLRLVGKVNPDRVYLRDIVTVMLRCLD